MAMLAGALRTAIRPRVMAGFTRPLAVRCFSVKYTKTHEWLKTEGEMGTLGISDFAQSALGEVVYCDLPEVGASLKGKETICTLESVKAVGEVYAPADCEVVEVNDKLSDEPALVNSSPQEDGWLVKVKFSGEPEGMLDQAAYDAHVEAESKEE
eukprot:CAMPEP_0194763172 /NCGR_PEP_ID=MMETSP0323_2-20130528/18345_1 /TAXON_ID=2866 ORGANISM="Crypthecodinium cohnii, Strain Seligo" /NCGR_SAMPLE_ID=MMETSP0323_2 /ASSEMBLY_ACC=CAM_ASM_000346 /LENGTH=153 /DNA_ID=CAMNT_0039687365 /DNA_START=57 /DNA_END=518 /DNA_ORIENTATION=+